MKYHYKDKKTSSNAKINIGVRVPPDQREKIVEHAQSAGMSPSELVETVLYKYSDWMEMEINYETDMSQYKTEIEVLKKEIQQIKLENAAQVLKNAELTTANTEMKKTLAKPTIYDDPKLLELFTQLKGIQAEVKMPDGFTKVITYNSVQDVLFVLVYTFKLRKSWLA